MKPDREFFSDLLDQALREFTEKQGRDVVYAAPLANRVRELLRVKSGDDKAELSGTLFGPALYPELNAVERAGLKFRDFLDAFPQAVEVFQTPSGDRVKVLDTEHAKRVDDLGTRYKGILIGALQDLVQFRKEPTVPTVQLIKWLKKRDPEFDIRKLGFTSLADWLESLRDTVELTHREFGGRVRFVEKPLAEQTPTSTPPLVSTGYLLVDSVDILSALHELLGTKPSQSQLPDWGQLVRFVQQRVPAGTWKGLYFMAIQQQQMDSLEGFRSYLEAVGYAVIPLASEGDPLDMARKLKERASATVSAIKRMLTALKGQKGHVLVVSHSTEIVEELSELLKARAPEVQIGVLCIPEMLPERLRRLRDSGLAIFDLEKEAGVFKQTLPRKKLISAEAFDPARFL
jgi:hypothetical protein